MGAPLEDARHLGQQYSRMRQEAETTVSPTGTSSLFGPKKKRKRKEKPELPLLYFVVCCKFIDSYIVWCTLIT